MLSYAANVSELNSMHGEIKCYLPFGLSYDEIDVLRLSDLSCGKKNYLESPDEKKLSEQRNKIKVKSLESFTRWKGSFTAICCTQTSQ
jgi:hypothetical protein